MGNPFRRTSSSTPKAANNSADPTSTDYQGSTDSTAPIGLLATSKVNVAIASKPQSENFNAMAGSHLYSSQLAGHHDASYYENWNRERQEAIARGEDPNAKFLALVAEREARSNKAKLRRLFSGMTSQRQCLTEEEEREALERDKAAKAARSEDDGVVR